LTLDELDDAFQAGQIDESVFVLQHGATAWTTLGVLLGIEAAPPVAATLAAPRAPVLPMGIPVAAPATPASGYASTFPSPYSSAASSLRPLVSEIDLDDVDFGRSRFRSSGKRKFVMAVGVAALALVGVAVARPNRAAAVWSTASSFFSTSNAAASQPVAAAAPPPAEAGAPPPAQPESTAPAAAQSDADRLSEERKRALLDADKARAEADKARALQHQAKASAAPAHHSAYKSDGKTVFHKGGNKYDPLNSSL
jgi:hypothetical protein